MDIGRPETGPGSGIRAARRAPAEAPGSSGKLRPLGFHWLSLAFIGFGTPPAWLSLAFLARPPWLSLAFPSPDLGFYAFSKRRARARCGRRRCKISAKHQQTSASAVVDGDDRLALLRTRQQETAGHACPPQFNGRDSQIQTARAPRSIARRSRPSLAYAVYGTKQKHCQAENSGGSRIRRRSSTVAPDASIQCSWNTRFATSWPTA